MESAEKVAAEHQTLVEDCHISRAATMDSNHRPQNHGPKSKQIEEACQWKDTHRLRGLALSEGGLVSDDMRRKAWPILLGFSADKTEPTADDQRRWQTLPKHADEDQVRLDVNRAFIYYPTDQTAKQIDTRKGELSDLITEVLRRQPYLCYFQGYHDICQVFLLVLGHKNCSEAVSRLSALHIRDFMLPTLAPALAQLRLIPGIIRTVNPKLYQHLSETQPFFALSGTLTMYAHDIQEYGDIARLFDVFLARESIFSVYMFAQIVLNRSEELFDTPADEPEMLHSILSKLPKPLNLERLISDTTKLLDQHPPESLPLWSKISKSSVLKTARSPEQVAKQSLKDGQMYFEKQVKELQWAERREKIVRQLWKNKNPAIIIGVGVLVGLLSYHMRKSPSIYHLVSELWK
ncbi:hypothetical protein VC83_01956 [Pseudogymnoascus destructans]|uniref:Rab-GAP TBC domain-containing protein n=1 Tax=Pseudogymnoascus destructans TaxID=655981 RepID=A0A177AHF4_9PEZI|nr:uncharacterized protein VC83_01956 [Pseudogymnoascus destructans]OAF61516.1 hypothetical protein VC83_01956 [Pseudogymnoascus destructans]